MKVICWKCGRVAKVNNKLWGNLLKIAKASGMIPIWKNPYDAFIFKWECRKHFIEEQRDIPSAFAQVLNKHFWKLI